MVNEIESNTNYLGETGFK